MATIVGIEPALLEMARGMPVEAIPEKLRCATCDKLAISAVKIPCCDSTICTYCHAGLSDTECPICTHSPFTASMCVPAKGLQATVKAFIKTEAKKRATEAAAAPVKSIEKSASVAAVENQPSTADMQTPQPQNGAGTPIISDTPAGDAMENPAVAAAGAEAQLEQTGRDEQIQKTTEDEDDQDGEDEDDDEDIVITTERSGEEHQDCQENGFPEDSSAMTQNGMSRQEGSNMPFQQNFNMMNMNGMDPAQVQFMQNMMGMSGMNMGMGMGMGPGMDPSMMFGNFGGMGGMNDMNMMSMMGMGGMNGMGDMGNFGGMGGPGFFPQGNYMQSNFGNQRQAPFFNNHGQGRPYGRGFGRGRGQYARGRGGWGQQQQYQQPYNQGGFHQQSDPTAQPDAPSRRGSPSYEGASEANGTPAVDGAPNQDDHAGHDDAPDANNADRADSAGGQTIEGAHSVQHEYDGHNGEYNNSNMDEGFDHNGGDYSQMPMMDPSGSFENQYQNFNDMGYQDQYGFNGGHRGGFNNRGGFGRGRGGYNGAHARGQDNTDLTPKSAPPLNAPTGPKALRQGLPNTGWSGRMATVPSAKQTPTTAVQSIGPDSENGDDAAHDRNQITDDRYQNGVNGKPESRNGRADSRSRSRSRNRSSKHRERSRSANEESEEARARRKERERERRKRKDRDRRYDEDDRARSRDGEDSRKRHRSRSRSPAEDSSRRHRRDDGDDYKSSRSRRERSKDRRRRRHRSRSGDRGDSDKHDDYSRRKERSRRDDDGGDGGHSSSRRHSRRDDDGYDDDRTRRSHHSGRDKDRNYHESSRAIVEPAIDDQLGFKIKGSKSAKSGSMGPPPTRERRSSHSESRDAPTTTSTSNSSDPYAEERARAQQNRVAAEAQRRQSSSLGKRSRHDDIADAPTGPRGMSSSAASSSSRSKKVKKDTRQISYKYEDEIGVDDRDSSRWR